MSVLKTIHILSYIYKRHRPVHEVLVLNASASSQGLDEPVHLHSVAIAFTARTHIGLDARKPVLGVSDKARLKPVSSATEPK